PVSLFSHRIAVSCSPSQFTSRLQLPDPSDSAVLLRPFVRSPYQIRSIGCQSVQCSY
ncbi:unnamed protein product, partial [Nesidiocoris tenuis]